MAGSEVEVYLVDGTYELFRHHFGQMAGRRASANGDTQSLGPRPDTRAHEGMPAGEPIHYAATRGALGSVLSLLENGARHVAVATDHTVESFRNGMWEGYKSSAGIPPELLAQFGVFEESLDSMGVTVWPMTEYEADDALASAASWLAADETVNRILICTPDKDLSQCVVGTRVVQLDRRARPSGPQIIDEAAVVERFGVGPRSIPDWLALVGDSADGFPGLSGWGAKSASAVLCHYGHLEAIPDIGGQWEVTVRGGAALARTLAEHRSDACLFKDLATLRSDALAKLDLEAVAWDGPKEDFGALCERIGAPGIARRASRLAKRT